jgi:hypothetical protein
MTNNENHNENQPGLNREILEMTSGSSIAWNKTKEDIWPEMLKKIEGKALAATVGRTSYIRMVKYAAAAIFVLLVGISSAMYFYTKTVKTALARQTEVFLPDHSKVTVYAQSVLSYKPLLWKFARVVKFEGEGLFEVQKGKKFEVVSPKGRTEVLGTQFDVYSRNNDYSVICISGKVKVTESAYQNHVIITGGQKAILKPDGNLEIINNINIQPEQSDKKQEQQLDEELNTVLSPAPAEAQPANKEHVPVEKQSAVKEQAIEEKQDNAREQNALKEQARSQTRAIEDIQNQGQSKTSAQEQTGNKEQEQNQEQEKAKGQSSGNPQNKDKFRTSLTPEQISILEDQKMSREEKRKAFMKSLSPEQRQLLDEQTKERARQGEGDKKGPVETGQAKEQQKMQMQEQMREGAGNESKEQQKQQDRENKENTRPGSGNGSGSGNGNKNDAGKEN